MDSDRSNNSLVFTHKIRYIYSSKVIQRLSPGQTHSFEYDAVNGHVVNMIYKKNLLQNKING